MVRPFNGEYNIPDRMMIRKGSECEAWESDLCVDQRGYFSEVKEFVDLTIPLYVAAIVLFIPLVLHSLHFGSAGQDEPFIRIRFEPPTAFHRWKSAIFSTGWWTRKIFPACFSTGQTWDISGSKSEEKEYRITKLKNLSPQGA